MEKYYNYHKHDHKGNPITLDVVVKLEDYCKRAIELGHDAIFTTNHGSQGDIFEATTLAHQYELKLIIGSEMYYVPNRKEKDRTNRHIILIALNENGIRELNEIISEANTSGFYYKPRIDDELLFSLTPENFVITTACVAGLWSDENLIIRLKEHFGFNFFLEVQNHNTKVQKEVNKKVLELSKKHNIKIMHANDSHYIFLEKDNKKQEATINKTSYKLLPANRDTFLKAKGIFYEEEEKFILDYPTYNEIVERYKKQGVLNKNQIKEALENTLIFENVDCSNYINDEIKLPSVSENPNEDLKKILNDSWNKEKENIDKKKWPDYLKAIREEYEVIEKTNMANYFLIDYYIVKIAREKYNGVLTMSGRGSAASFYTINLLGLTNIDRLKAPITLFPTRFMSVERILGARAIPDIDLNSADSEPFIKASEDLLGKENCAWMISWKPLQEASAFRLYCKAIGMKIDEYNEVAKDLEKYKKQEEWNKIIEASKPFIGVVEGISESPCSICLGTTNLIREVGLIKTPNNKICCILDGYNCDKYKYLKNDYLTTTVWAIIRDVCSLVNIPIPTIRELDKLLDEKTFDIYAKGLTCTINQADSDYATNLVMKYKPKTLAEMSAFVAIIRPGCASLLEDFINRKPYTTGISKLDELLEDSGHLMIYQESIMKYLIWLGVPEAGSYDIIKKIAKKKFKEPELKELKANLLEGWKKQVGKEEGFEETWKVVEDASHYSFNCSHSLSYAYDSLYGAYLKSHYPLEYYTVVLNYYNNDSERTTKLNKELSYFNISLNRPKFRYSKADYFMDKKTNTIYKGTGSIKFLNKEASDYLYTLKDETYPTFTSLLTKIEEDKKINSRQMEILIKLQYFEEFGKNKKLLEIYSRFKKLYGRKQLTKEKLADYKLSVEDIKENFEKETEKQYIGINYLNILEEMEKKILDENIPLGEQVAFELEMIGYINAIYDVDKRICFVTSLNTKYSPVVTLYSLGSGKYTTCKISKQKFKGNPFKEGQILKCKKFEKRNKMQKTENGWRETEEREWWLSDYEILEDFEEE